MNLKALFIPAVAAMLTLSAFASAQTADPQSPTLPRLSDQRYREPGFGLSFRPPADATFSQQTAQGAIAQWSAPGQYVLSLMFKQTDKPFELDQVLKLAPEQFGFRQPNARLLDQGKFRAAGRPGAAIYMLVPAQDQRPSWVLGQAFIKLDPQHMAVFQVRCPGDRYKPTRAMLEGVLVSAQLEDMAELDRQRQQHVQAGADLLETVTPDRLRQATPANRLLRILGPDGRDVGFRKVTRSTTDRLDQTGTEVEVRQTQRGRGMRSDVQQQYFAADNGTTEVWSVRTTRRRTGSSQTRSWADTGFRHNDLITLDRQTPSRSEQSHWQAPPTAYLSQVQLRLIEPLMLAGGERELAFYAYDAKANDVVLRTVTIHKLAPDDGTDSHQAAWRIDTRASPDAPIQQAYYDARGQLLRRVTPQGATLVPTTARALQKIWAGRDLNPTPGS